MNSAPTLFAERRPWGVFSACHKHGFTCGVEACPWRPYRYVLAWPTGLENDRYALFVLANPSTATPEETDPTVARTIGYARRWGYGWSRVVNVRAWRETDPKCVPADPLAVGPDNWRHVREQAELAGIVVAGWGKLGGELGRKLLADLRGYGVVPHALKFNSDGSPAHPLYLRADAVPFPMEVA